MKKLLCAATLFWVGWFIASASHNNVSFYISALQVNQHRHHYHYHPHHDQSLLNQTFRKSGSTMVQRLSMASWRCGGGEGVGGWAQRIVRQRKKGSAGVVTARTDIVETTTTTTKTPPKRNVDNNDEDLVVRKDKGFCFRRRTTIIIGQSCIGVLALAMVLYYRASWTPYFNKEMIQEKTLSLLRQLRNGEDAADSPASWQALFGYAMGLMVWEAAGLSTIPVETAAGMVFRFHEAALSSIVGKVLGATLAFLAGRTVLSTSLDQNPTISTSRLFVLLRSRNTHRPILTAALMKFSILPELVKNLGSAVLPQIKLWMFMAVTLFHGGSFSLMWTWLGTSMRLKETSRALQMTLIIGVFVGGVLTPLTMGWWIRALQSMSEQTTISNQQEKEAKPISNRKGIMRLKQRMDAYLTRPTSLAEIWIGGLCVASIAAVVLTRNAIV